MARLFSTFILRLPCQHSEKENSSSHEDQAQERRRSVVEALVEQMITHADALIDEKESEILET